MYVIDVMQVVQTLHKPDYLKTFKDLAQVFTDKIIDTSSGSTTIIVAFDEYRTRSLKAATREKRTGGGGGGGGGFQSNIRLIT